jgi:DNA polymerase III delta prime subunit
MFKDFPKNLHHAYFIEGERESALPELLKFFEKKLGIKTQGDPDFLSFEYDAFGIDEGRWLKEAQMRKPVGERKIFVISLNSITHEAQNSLLKVFEEPAPNTHFFIISKSSESLLPTLKSRLQIILAKTEKEEDNSANEFLKMNLKQRLDFLADMIEDKSKTQAIDFLNNLEMALSEKTDIKKNTLVFEEIIKC